MAWQRARNPEQKEERVARILEAAGALFDECGFADISMRDIASRTGLGKASLYHYFRTREEVFLSLFESELEAWLPDVEVRLKRLRSPNPARIAAAMTMSIRDRTRFCGLMTVLAAVLEHNVSPEFMSQFKHRLLAPMQEFLIVLDQVAPGISEADTSALMKQIHALIAGLWPLANPSPVLDEVLQQEALAVFRFDFYQLFERSMEQLLSTIMPD